MKKVNDEDLEMIDLTEDSADTTYEMPEDDIENLEDDMEDLEDQEDELERPKAKHGFRMNLHVFLIGAMVLIVIICAVKLFIWNKGTKEDPALESRDTTEFDTEALDYITPLSEELRAGQKDDGKTTIVCLGNAPFADDRESEDGLCNLIAKKADATVYNCSIGDSFMASWNEIPSKDYPLDAFSFYWLTSYFTVNNKENIDLAKENQGGFTEEQQLALDTLDSIDFSTVDVIAIMYDANDYLTNRNVYNDDKTDSVMYFTGALQAGINLIQNAYPYIRIIVMSPTFAYSVDESGEYVSGDLPGYGNAVLSTYVIKEVETCYGETVSIVDNFYGTISEENAKQYLTDNLHVNAEGRNKLADRFLYALTRYDDKDNK